MNHLLRQLQNLQIQAAKICEENASLEQILEFGRFSNELKNVLQQEVKDEFTQTLSSEIPNLHEELKKQKISSKLL